MTWGATCLLLFVFQPLARAQGDDNLTDDADICQGMDPAEARGCRGAQWIFDNPGNLVAIILLVVVGLVAWPKMLTMIRQRFPSRPHAEDRAVDPTPTVAAPRVVGWRVLSLRERAALVGGAVGVIGILGPWFRLPGENTIYGYATQDGWVIAALLGGAVALLWTRRMAGLACFLLVLAAVIAYVDLRDSIRILQGALINYQYALKWGLPFALAGSVAAAVAAFSQWLSNRRRA